MRSALACLFLLGCSLGPPPSVHPPRAPVCGALAQGMVGTWVRDRSAMEIRTDGTMLRDGIEGTFRWTAPGHATIDVPGLHEEHTFGMMTAAQLLDVDTDGRSWLWGRVSIVPQYPDGCFALTGSLVGDWTDGAVTESFRADGTYFRGESRGRWFIAEPGYIDLSTGLIARRYRIALAAPDLIVSAFDGVAPEDDPRGATIIEHRIR